MQKQRIKDLEKRLRVASAAYYRGGDAIMSDAEFDKLRDELEGFDPHNKFLSEIGAPTDESALQKVPHSIPMGSLKKITTLNELFTWVSSVANSPKLPDCWQFHQVAIQCKLDGLSIELVYENGKFVQAITRGDGEIGEDVTHTIKNAQYFPRKISVTNRRVSVRCEALLQIADWKTYFADKANPRNAASGLVRRTDAKGSEHIVCVAFDVLFDNSGFKTEKDRIAWLTTEGFTATSNEIVDCAKIEQAIKRIEDQRDTLPFEIDGAVLKINDIATQEKLGEHNGRPYWARAWKFAAMGGFTTLEGVTWSVGTQGTINPVANIAPVAVGGTTIRNVSLHNMDEIDRLGIQIGDKIEVVRAGDVIPHIVRVVAPGKKRKTITIDNCPVCGAKLNRKGPKLICSNSGKCVGVAVKKIEKWVKKRRIMYLGTSNLESLIVNGVVTSIVSLYSLTSDKMVDAGLGRGMADKIFAQIEKSKTCTLSDFIGSLSIDMLGRSEAKNLVNHGFDTLAKWANLSITKIMTLPGYQRTKATRIWQALKTDWPLVKEVATCLTIVSAKPQSKSGKLNGLSFCLTGSMTKPRKLIEQNIIAAGGTVSNISAQISYLCQADPKSKSSKSRKAERLGIPIISEQQLYDML